MGREHGRRINREENGKVITAVWGGGAEFIPFLANYFAKFCRDLLLRLGKFCFYLPKFCENEKKKIVKIGKQTLTFQLKWQHK